MKLVVPTSSCWVLLLGVLALLLVEQPVAAQFTMPDSGSTTTLAPTMKPTTKAPTASAPVTAPTTTTTTPPAVPPAGEEEDEVVVDVLVAGASQEQVEAIAALIKFLQMSNKLTVNHEKVNATVTWEHPHADKDERRFLRSSKAAAMAKDGALEEDEDINAAYNRTRCSLILNGGNYSVVHLTLHGKADKAMVNLVMNLLTNPHLPPQIYDAHGVPILDYVCKTNVRMQSEAPPADFAPMSVEPEKEGLSAGAKAGVAVGVIGGAAAVGAVGYFAFQGFAGAGAAVV